MLSIGPVQVRCVAFLQNDTLLLTSYIDRPGLGVWDLRQALTFALVISMLNYIPVTSKQSLKLIFILFETSGTALH